MENVLEEFYIKIDKDYVAYFGDIHEGEVRMC